MTLKVFQDKLFPRHVSDLMNLMHMVVFKGTDGEEKWDTFLNLEQKEYVALGLAQYYQCEHCVEHHLDALCRLAPVSKAALSRNVNAMILFLRIDTRSIGKAEKAHWIDAWRRFASRVSHESEDEAMPYLMGLAIGMAQDDDFLIEFCGHEVKRILSEQGISMCDAIGELQAVVIFMKAAASKNRIADKLGAICDIAPQRPRSTRDHPVIMQREASEPEEVSEPA